MGPKSGKSDTKLRGPLGAFVFQIVGEIPILVILPDLVGWFRERVSILDSNSLFNLCQQLKKSARWSFMIFMRQKFWLGLQASHFFLSMFGLDILKGDRVKFIHPTHQQFRSPYTRELSWFHRVMGYFDQFATTVLRVSVFAKWSSLIDIPSSIALIFVEVFHIFKIIGFLQQVFEKVGFCSVFSPKVDSGTYTSELLLKDWSKVLEKNCFLFSAWFFLLSFEKGELRF